MLPELSSVCSAIVHIGVLRKLLRPVLEQAAAKFIRVMELST